MKLLHACLFILIFSNLFASVPDWITNIGPCLSTEICVVGSGNDLKSAMSEGRSEMARFFETKVKVNTQLESMATQNSLSFSESKFLEWNSKIISEETDELLSGIVTKRSEEVKGVFYVLLSLDKVTVETNLRQKIENIDKENEILFKKNSRFLFPKIYLNLKKRIYYNNRHVLVSNGPIIPFVSEEKILKTLETLPPINMALVSGGDKLPASIIHLMENTFSSLKIVFVPAKSNPKFKMRVKLSLNEDYFKVEGFKKLNLILKIEHMNSKSIILGRLSATSTQIARSKEQALEAALEDLSTQIKENLEQLVTIKTGESE